MPRAQTPHLGLLHATPGETWREREMPRALTPHLGLIPATRGTTWREREMPRALTPHLDLLSVRCVISDCSGRRSSHISAAASRHV
jgi:hypothetical protein